LSISKRKSRCRLEEKPLLTPSHAEMAHASEGPHSPVPVPAPRRSIVLCRNPSLLGLGRYPTGDCDLVSEPWDSLEATPSRASNAVPSLLSSSRTAGTRARLLPYGTVAGYGVMLGILPRPSVPCIVRILCRCPSHFKAGAKGVHALSRFDGRARVAA
jgi:hypothetical protein